MRLAPLLLLLAGSASCEKPRWDIGLDVVFPGNATYKSGADYPVVFLIHNAYAAFQYGFTLNWQISQTTSDAEVKASGNITQEPRADNPVNTTKNEWYPIDHMEDSAHLSPGPYNFTWTWVMRTCSIADSTIQIDPSDRIARGSVIFTLSDSAKEGFSLTSECPILGAQIYVDAAEPASEYMASCPYVSDKDTKNTHNCDSKLSESTASCLMSNLTGKGDTSHCPQLIATNLTSNDTSSGDEDGDNGNSTSTDNNGGGDDNTGAVLLASQVGVWAALGATFFSAFLL